MSSSDMKDAFVAAAEIAKSVPKHLQEIAFNRALDQLLKGVSSSGSAHSPAGRTKGEKSATASLLERIDRTRYPDIGATSRLGDRALKVLQLAETDLDIDGLTGAEISEILTKKFKLPARADSVRKALERETGTVDERDSPDRGRTFHLMAPGEDYLSRLRAGTTDEAPSPRRRAGSKGRGRANKIVEKPERSDKVKKELINSASPRKNASTRKSGGRPGPKAAVGDLIKSGFFGTPRTISDIQRELKHKRGHAYSLQELSPALVRSLRDRALSRERNSAGQYEYTA